MLRRLQFRWWGRFWRGWLQFGPGLMTCADKDVTVLGKTFFIGPVEITWWSRSDWERYCYTAEEAGIEDEKWL